MRKGQDLMDLISKIGIGIVFILFVISFFIPQGRILIIVAFGFFFTLPISQEILYYFYKFLYRNIEVAEGFLDEEKGMFEKFKWRIIKVIPLELLPDVLHEKYLGLVEQNYQQQLRDKSMEELNKFLLIDKEGNVEYGKRPKLTDKEGNLNEEKTKLTDKRSDFDE